MWLLCLIYRPQGWSRCFDKDRGGFIPAERIIRLFGIVHQKYLAPRQQ